MKQIIQNLKNGKTSLIDIPIPQVDRGSVLIKSRSSLVSLGTEKMIIDLVKQIIFRKSDNNLQFKQVIDKIKSDGLIPTIEQVFRKLNQPLPLGYCNSGVIVAVGDEVDEFQVGDRVASNGCHAEYVSVPKNLVVKIPEKVSYDEASFTVIGSVGLQGIRLLSPTYDETIVVSGLGLIGLVSIQILKSNGCRVIAFDNDDNKVLIAKKLGIDAYNISNINPLDITNSYTKNIGVDGVLITASTKSNDLISQSAKMCRRRGKIVLVGVIGLDINRSDMYEKELTFQVSCSYGPGRYDYNYEEKGLDYPISHVRWTQNRNFEAIINSIQSGKINVKPLITKKVNISDYKDIYNDIKNKIYCIHN